MIGDGINVLPIGASTLTTEYTMLAGTGVFTEAGVDAGDQHHRKLLVDPAAFVVGGQSIEGHYARRLVAQTGVFTETNVDVNLLATKKNLKSNVFLDIRNSLLKYCKDANERGDFGFQIFDFDSHASIHEMPNENLLGIGEYSITNLDRHYEVTVMIAVCTRADDSYLDELVPVIDFIFNELRPGFKGISVLNSSGNLVGNMAVMDNVMVLPMGRADNRPIQFIAVKLASSFLVPP